MYVLSWSLKPFRSGLMHMLRNIIPGMLSDIKLQNITWIYLRGFVSCFKKIFMTFLQLHQWTAQIRTIQNSITLFKYSKILCYNAIHLLQSRFFTDFFLFCAICLFFFFIFLFIFLLLYSTLSSVSWLAVDYHQSISSVPNRQIFDCVQIFIFIL